MCHKCFYYIDDGGELFGTNPNCIHPDKPSDMDLVMDGEIECPKFKDWPSGKCNSRRHFLMKGIWTICPECRADLLNPYDPEEPKRR